jgi:hypothetical protein
MPRTLVGSAALLVGALLVEACSSGKFRAGEQEAAGKGGATSGTTGASGEGGDGTGGTDSKGGTGTGGKSASGGKGGGASSGGKGGSPGGGTSGTAGDEGGSGGSDPPSVCAPNARTCNENVARLCNETGTDFVSSTDCTAIGSRCLNGRCETGLIAYWPFDEGSGSQVTDASGNGYDATATGTEWVEGVVGGAIRIGPSSAYVSVGDQMNDVAPPFSVSAWVWVDASERPALLVASDANSESWYGFWIQRLADGTLDVSYGSGSGAGPRTRRTLTTEAPLPAQEWVHIAAVVGPELSLFVNGVEATGTLSGSGGAMVHSADPFFIGTRDRLDTGWNGRVDELRIYGRALSPEEISALADF